MDPHDAHAAAARHNNALVRGTYEEGYSAGKAEGIKEGMRLAAEIMRGRKVLASDFYYNLLLKEAGE